MVEQRFCKPKVTGSIPVAGTIRNLVQPLGPRSARGCPTAAIAPGYVGQPPEGETVRM
jgi:hypothetical protein